MGWLVFLAMTAAVTADGPARPIFTIAQARAATPDALADALLPATHPPIVRAQILPAGADPTARTLESILLSARPAPGPRGFCQADTFQIAFTPLEYATDPGAGTRFRARGTTPASVFRVADTGPCLADMRGYFPVAGARDQGLAAVRALVAVRASAENNGRLPTVTCADTSRGKACTGGTRAVLAGLRTDAIGGVRVLACPPAACSVEILVGTAGTRPAYWTVAMTLRGGTASRITLAYTLSPGA